MAMGSITVRHADSFAWQIYEGVSKSFRTGRLERELQMAKLSAIRCSFIAILWVSLVRFVAITLCIASQWVFIIIIIIIILLLLWFRYRLSPQTFGYTLVNVQCEKLQIQNAMDPSFLPSFLPLEVPKSSLRFRLGTTNTSALNFSYGLQSLIILTK
jgi:hypothetical protein